MKVIERTRSALNIIAGSLAFLGLIGFFAYGGGWAFLISIIAPVYLPFIALGVLHILYSDPKLAKYRKGLVISIAFIIIILCPLFMPSLITDLYHESSKLLSIFIIAYLCSALICAIFEIIALIYNRIKTPKEALENNPITPETKAIRFASLITLLFITGFTLFTCLQKEEFEGTITYLFLLALVTLTISIFGFSRKIHYIGYLTTLICTLAGFAIFYYYNYHSYIKYVWSEPTYLKNIIMFSCMTLTTLVLISTIIACGIKEIKKANNKAVQEYNSMC